MPDQEQPRQANVPTLAEAARWIGSQRENAYTPAGRLAMFDDFVGATARARGWKRWVASGVLFTIFVLPLLLAGAGMLLGR